MWPIWVQDIVGGDKEVPNNNIYTQKGVQKVFEKIAVHIGFKGGSVQMHDDASYYYMLNVRFFSVM